MPPPGRDRCHASEARRARQRPIDGGAAAAHCQVKQDGVASDLSDVRRAHSRNGAEHQLDVGVIGQARYPLDFDFCLAGLVGRGSSHGWRKRVNCIVDPGRQRTTPALSAEISIELPLPGRRRPGLRGRDRRRRRRRCRLRCRGWRGRGSSGTRSRRGCRRRRGDRGRRSHEELFRAVAVSHREQRLARQQVAAFVSHRQGHDADRKPALLRGLLESRLIRSLVVLARLRIEDYQGERAVRIPDAAVNRGDRFVDRRPVEENLHLASRAAIVALDILRRVRDQPREDRIGRRLAPASRADQRRAHGLLQGRHGLARHIDLENRDGARSPRCRRQHGACSKQQCCTDEGLRGCVATGHRKCLDRAVDRAKCTIPYAKAPACTRGHFGE